MHTKDINSIDKFCEDHKDHTVLIVGAGISSLDFFDLLTKKSQIRTIVSGNSIFCNPDATTDYRSYMDNG